MPRKIDRTPSMGSISSGTLRADDLIHAFLDELCHVAPRAHGKLKREARREIARDCAGEFACDIVSDLMDALGEHAPPFLYFGTHEGDCADFGWWPCWEKIDELPAYDDTGKAAEDKYIGDFKVVSDHGNVDLYCRFTNGHIRNYFGIV